MKKTLAVFLTVTMVLLLVACGNNSVDKEAPSSSISTTAIAPHNANDCIGTGQSNVENDFHNAGFENITTEKVEDLESSESDKVGAVISVSIDGQSEFEQGQEFDKSAEVVISYHTFKKYAVTIHVNFVENLIFSKYNVIFNINDESQETLEHGKDKDFELSLYPGEYIFSFEKEDSSDVNGSTTFNVVGDSDITLEITCHSDEIDVETLSVIDLEAEKQKEAEEAKLEEIIPKETAKRAVVVAMTNCQATDVFMDDGNTYDTSKFHTYSDIEDFFMTVDMYGTWSVLDESTWHVDGMILRIFDYDTYLKVTCNIRKEGDNYILSDVDKTIAEKDYINSDDTSKINAEHLEPSESNPFLTVPSALISEERDTEAAQEKMTAKEKRQEWIESQFSFWDGRHVEFCDLIKENLNDESSFKHSDASYIDVSDEGKMALVNQTLANAGFDERVEIGDLFLIEEFTAKNMFNATIKNTAYGIVRGTDSSVILLGIS